MCYLIGVSLSAWGVWLLASLTMWFKMGALKHAVHISSASRGTVDYRSEMWAVCDWASVKTLDTRDLGKHLCLATLLRIGTHCIREEVMSSRTPREMTRNYTFGPLWHFTPSVSSFGCFRFLPLCNDTALLVCTVLSWVLWVVLANSQTRWSSRPRAFETSVWSEGSLVEDCAHNLWSLVA